MLFARTREQTTRDRVEAFWLLQSTLTPLTADIRDQQISLADMQSDSSI